MVWICLDPRKWKGLLLKATRRIQITNSNHQLTISWETRLEQKKRVKSEIDACMIRSRRACKIYHRIFLYDMKIYIYTAYYSIYTYYLNINLHVCTHDLWCYQSSFQFLKLILKTNDFSPQISPWCCVQGIQNHLKLWQSAAGVQVELGHFRKVG